ncbi:MAG: prohibitin family protein [Oscillospiraceae bacterium]
MDKKMPKFAKRLLVIVPCAIAALIVVAGCFDIVPAGYKGVKLTMGAVGDTVLNEGLAFKLPFAQRIVHVDARVKKYTVEGETSASKDMQSITTNVAVNYRVDGANVDELYKNLSLNYEDTIIAPAVSECIKSVTSQYTAEETITRRSEISSQIKDMLKERLEDKYIFVDSLNITDLTFSAAFDKAIEEKQVAEQNALKAKYDLERIKTEAEQAVIKAKGEAEAMEIKNKALTESIIELEFLEKWDVEDAHLLRRGRGFAFVSQPGQGEGGGIKQTEPPAGHGMWPAGGSVCIYAPSQRCCRLRIRRQL